jgi:hypothetical protein
MSYGNEHKQTNKQKYGSFGAYILQDPAVYRWLYMLGLVFPPVAYAVILYTLYVYQHWEIFVIICLFSLAFIYRLYKFFKNGGMKAIPKDMNANDMIWGGKIKCNQQKNN